MECGELSFRALFPICVGQVVKLIEMHGWKAEFLGKGDREGRLAGIGRAEDDDALAKGMQGKHRGTGRKIGIASLG